MYRDVCQETLMTTVEKTGAAPEPPELAAPAPSERAKYLAWVAQRVRGEDFWMNVKEDIIEDFASLLNRDLPEELWIAAYSQRDGQDYLIALEAVLERLQDHCRQITRRR
jgi:hypothetical protein